MRRINWKFAAGLAAVLLSVGVAGWLLHEYQSGRVAAALLEQARQCRDDGQAEQAIRLAGQYLALRPQDAAAMVELAEWLRERATSRKQLGSVAGLYEKALRINDRDTAVRRKAAETYIKIGRYGEALDHIERLLPEFPADAELLTQAGWCQQAAGKHDAAAELYRRAIRASAQHVAAYLALANLQANQQKNVEQAGETFAQAVAANPDSAEARAALAAFHRRYHRLADAAREVAEGLCRNPDHATLLFTAADIAAASGDLKTSHELLDRGSRAHPSDTRFACSLAWQLLHDGRADLAVQKLRAAQSANPGDVDVLTLLADILAQDGQIAPLETALRDLQNASAPPDRVQPRIRYIEARLAMRRGRHAEALAILDSLRPVAQRLPSLNRQVSVLSAQCAEQLGDTAAQLDALKRLIDQDPNSGVSRLDYARALARAGRLDDAVRELTSVAARREVAPRAVAAAARSLIASARGMPSDWTAFQQIIDGLKLDDANPNPTLVRGELERVRHRPDAILPQLMRNLTQQPSNVALHVLRAELFELKFGTDRALAALAEAEQWAGDHPELRMVRARLIAARGDRTRAEVLAALGQNLESFPADDRLQVLRHVTAGLRLLEDAGGVTRTLERLALVRPDDFACREALHAIAQRRGDEARRTALLAEIEALEGKNGASRARLEAEHCIWLGDTARFGQAEDLLAVAERFRPIDPAIPFLRARMAECLGQADAAREQYRRAMQRGFLAQPLEELLNDAPGSSGQAPLAILRDVLAAEIRLDTPPSMVLAAVPILDTAARQRLADRLLAECPPDHAANQAWLGQLFSRMGLEEKSETALRRSAAASPTAHDAWAALLMDRLAAGDDARLRTAIAEVRQALPPIEANLLVGRAFEAAQRFSEARQMYESAAALKPDDPRALRALAGLALVTHRSADALSALESLARLPDSVSANDTRWARRQLALQLAQMPTLANSRRALELLEQNRVGDGWLPDDIRARALVLAAQKSRPIGDGSRTARQEAIRLLETLQERSPSRTADDCLVLAKLYRAENDEAKLRDLRDRMRREFAGHYGCTAFLVREALHDGNWSEAETRLATLRRLGPQLLDTAFMEAELHLLSGRPDQAVARLREATASGPTPEARAERGRQSAAFVVELLKAYPQDRRPEAAASLRRLAIEQLSALPAGDAEGFQRLMTLLAQDGQAAAALERLRAERDRWPADVLAAAFVTVVRFGQVEPRQVQSIENELRDWLARQPNANAVRVSLGDLYQVTNRPAQAVAAYREVLAREPENVAALNNLAWTLAAESQPSAEALRLIERAIELAGPIDELLDTRARVRFVGGDPAAGARDLAEALAAAPSAVRLLDLATMHRQAGQSELADRALQKARQYGVGDPSPR